MTERKRRPGARHALKTTSEKQYWAQLYERSREKVQAQFARQVKDPSDVEEIRGQYTYFVCFC